MREISCSLARVFLWASFSSALILRVAAAALARSFVSTAPVPLVGRSRIWPTLDFTTNSLPRYLFMVLALAGDSTITNDLLINWTFPDHCCAARQASAGHLPGLKCRHI